MSEMYPTDGSQATHARLHHIHPSSHAHGSAHGSWLISEGLSARPLESRAREANSITSFYVTWTPHFSHPTPHIHARDTSHSFTHTPLHHPRYSLKLRTDSRDDERVTAPTARQPQPRRRPCLTRHTSTSRAHGIAQTPLLPHRLGGHGRQLVRERLRPVARIRPPRLGRRRQLRGDLEMLRRALDWRHP